MRNKIKLRIIPHLFYFYFYYFNCFLSYFTIPSFINTLVYLVYFPSLLLLHSLQFSPIILTLPQGQHLSILRPVLAQISEKPLFVSSPPPYAVLILYSSNLFICIFNFYCWFICNLFI
jgi:hypothetical protein